jgi:glutamine phosphoribosylpyrophosphate amidotransferase
MCAIIGFTGSFDDDVITKVLYNSRIRGLHAFGYAFYDSNGSMRIRKFLDYNHFVENLLQDRPNTFIAHFRYSTSGDYMIEENNQPLQYGDFVFAFNGVISQKTKAEMESDTGITLPSDNDGYILAHNINMGDKLNWLSSSSISYALVGLKNGKLVSIRNKMRPMYLSVQENYSIIVSTKDIFKRSGINSYKEIQPLVLETH